MKTLTGKVILVTGASRGIGAAIARRLANEGAQVIVNYAGSLQAAEQTVNEIKRQGGDAIALQADVSKSDEVKALFDAAISHFGKIDVLVNNAGIMLTKLIKDTTDDDFTRQFGINVRGTFNTLREAATKLADNGSVINFSSTTTRVMMPTYGTYVASKGAVEQLTRVFAKEVGARGINVNVVSPGPTNTKLFTDGKPQEVIDRLASLSAFNRIGEPEDIAKIVAFLASDEAKWISAQNIGINGEWLDHQIKITRKLIQNKIMNSLTNKVALITGSARGLGKAIAERYAAMGADIVINYSRDKASADEVMSNIKAMGVKVISIQADVSKVTEIERLFKEAINTFGKIDIVVANAGIEMVETPVVDFTEEQFDRLFAINTKGSYFTMQQAAKHIKDNGRIIYIASSTTSFPVPGMAVYGGSKTTPRYLVDILSKEIGHKGVTVNSIIPFAVNHSGIFAEAGSYPELRKQLLDSCPMGRLAEVEDVANAAEFFASDLSSFVSGQHLLVNGGATN